jgi:acetyl esterase/lipase
MHPHSAQIRPKGFIVFGVSAGANISIAVSQLARDNALSPPLTGVALSIPPVFDIYNPPEEYKSELIAYEQNKDAPFLDLAITHQFVDAYGYDGNSKLATPFAGPKDEWNFKDLPPTAFWVCGMDPLRDDGIIYDRVLKENGVKTQFTMYPGLPHGFWSFAPTMEISKQAVKDFVEGIRWLLEQK